MALFVSLFIFDAPGSETNPVLWALLGSLWLYPIPVLTAVILYWRKRKTIQTGTLKKYALLSLSGPLAVGFFILLIETL